MIDRLIEDEKERTKLLAVVSRHRLPFRASVQDGRPRSYDQNRLMWQWAKDAAFQRPDMTVADVQCEWKLLFGVPILLTENETFAEAWFPVDASCTYEQKINLMRVLAVTTLMTVDQMKRFLNAVLQFNLENGIDLTDPEEMQHGPKSGSRVARSDPRRADPPARKAKDRRAAGRSVR